MRLRRALPVLLAVAAAALFRRPCSASAVSPFSPLPPGVPAGATPAPEDLEALRAHIERRIKEAKRQAAEEPAKRAAHRERERRLRAALAAVSAPAKSGVPRRAPIIPRLAALFAGLLLWRGLSALKAKTN